MKIAIQCSDERGNTKFDWLDSKHSFSFEDCLDRGRILLMEVPIN